MLNLRPIALNARMALRAGFRVFGEYSPSRVLPGWRATPPGKVRFYRWLENPFHITKSQPELNIDNVCIQPFFYVAGSPASFDTE